VTARSLNHRVAVAAAALTSATLVLTGCGGDSSDDASGTGGGSTEESLPTVSADDALAGMVPEDIASDGVLAVGSDTTYAPNEFLDEDGKTIIGFDVDLFGLVAQKLGLEAQFETAGFDTIIAGVGSGKYEVGVSSFTVNPERMQQANMISYYSAGTQWSTKKGNPNDVDPDNACGLKIAVQKATVQVDDITARSEECEAAGEEPITIDQYEGQDVRGPADQRSAGTARRHLRRRALRLRRRQGPDRVRAGDRRRGAVAHRRRQLPEGPGEVGRRGRRHRRPDREPDRRLTQRPRHGVRHDDPPGTA
jgi:ABC-type amino acid transport substrate-binding protein